MEILGEGGNFGGQYRPGFFLSAEPQQDIDDPTINHWRPSYIIILNHAGIKKRRSICCEYAKFRLVFAVALLGLWYVLMSTVISVST